MSKTVLHFADFKSPCRGNFINSLEALREAVGERGWNTVYVFPAATAGRDWAQELGRQTAVYYLSGRFLADLKLLRRVIKRHDVSLIHHHFYKLPYVLLFDLAAWGKKIPQLIHLHCALHIHQGPARVIEKFLLRGKAFIGCSEKLTDDAKRFYPKNPAFTAKNAIFFPRLEQFEPLDKAALGLRENAKTLMLFGFLYEVKGVDLALEALESLNRTGDAADLILILTSNREAIREKITQRFGAIPAWLHLLPPRNDIASYFRLCDLFLAPSRSEGLPYSVLEAAWLKVPTVLSDIPAHTALALPCASFFPCGNASALTEKIRQILRSPPSEARLTAQSEAVFREYRLEEWIKTVLNIYDKQLKNRRFS